MSTTSHSSPTATTNEQQTERTTDRPTDFSTASSWTERCGAQYLFDPSSSATMGQFDTTADEY